MYALFAMAGLGEAAKRIANVGGGSTALGLVWWIKWGRTSHVFCQDGQAVEGGTMSQKWSASCADALMMSQEV